jgi:hypothetical protein
VDKHLGVDTILNVLFLARCQDLSYEKNLRCGQGINKLSSIEIVILSRQSKRLKPLFAKTKMNQFFNYLRVFNFDEYFTMVKK